MKANVIKWGIVGPGSIAREFVQDLHLVEGAVVHAVASRNLHRAQSFAAEHGVTKAYNSLENMILDQEIDILYVATPNSIHLEQTLMSLTNGIAVLCEKPATLNTHELEQITDASALHRAFFMEALWTRFIPATRVLLDIVAGGEMGVVDHVEAEFCFTAPVDPSSILYDLSLGGGSILDIGIYPIFLSYLLLGVPEVIQASAQLAESGVDQTCSMSFKYADRSKEAALHSSILYHSTMPARITMSKGYVLLQDPWYNSPALTIIKAGQQPKTIKCPSTGKGYTHEIDEVHHCLTHDTIESLKWSHRDSLNLCGILDTIRRQVGVIIPGRDPLTQSI